MFNHEINEYQWGGCPYCGEHYVSDDVCEPPSLYDGECVITIRCNKCGKRWRESYRFDCATRVDEDERL